MRVTGPTDRAAVVCVNGGQAREVEGTLSASLEWLARRLAPALPAVAFVEVRYRIKSWRRLEWCIEDARGAVHDAGAPRTLTYSGQDGRSAKRVAQQSFATCAAHPYCAHSSR